MRILVSGFERFGNHTSNPTQNLVEAIGRDIPAPKGAEVKGVCLPVTFASAFARLQSEIQTFDPDVVIAFGMAAGRTETIDLERVAINCIDAGIADNAGVQPVDAPIVSDGPPAIFSTLPLKALLTELKAAGFPAQISNSAGTYVCNFLFYRLMEANLRTRRRCGFIHVNPALPLETLKNALAQILKTLVS